MRKILRLTKREFIASVKTKGFIIALLLAPLFMGGSFIVMAITKDKVDTKDKKIAIVDRSGMLASVLIESANQRNSKEIYDQKTGKKVKPAYLFETITPSEKPETQRLELSDRVRNDSLYAFAEIGQNIVHPQKNDSRITYYAKNAALDDIRRWIEWPINDRLRTLRLKDAGIDASTVKDLFVWVSAEGMGLVSVDTGTGEVKEAKRANEAEAVIVPIVMLMLMFMMIQIGAMPLLNSVMEEKTQRIAEVLLGSITPFEFMMGKVLGGVGVALTGAAVYVIGGIFTINRMGYGEYVPYQILPWFFAYMLLAITMFGALFTALGSACNDPRDAQSFAMPAVLLVLIPMFLITPILRDPQGSFSILLSFFPPFTPFIMLMRQSLPGGIPIWQPWIGVLGMIVFTVLFVWGGGRIFRIGILSQGETPKIGNILRWAVRG
jgi:ABC-2 type transport system permease protein